MSTNFSDVCVQPSPSQPLNQGILNLQTHSVKNLILMRVMNRIHSAVEWIWIWIKLNASGSCWNKHISEVIFLLSCYVFLLFPGSCFPFGIKCSSKELRRDPGRKWAVCLLNLSGIRISSPALYLLLTRNWLQAPEQSHPLTSQIQTPDRPISGHRWENIYQTQILTEPTPQTHSGATNTADEVKYTFDLF